MSGSQPMSQVGLGALHLTISVPKLWTHALVVDQSFHEEHYIYGS